MDRIATGIMIAIAAVVMSGVSIQKASADDAGFRQPATAAIKSQAPVVLSPTSERVLSLLLTLEALRAAPGLLDKAKV